MRAGAARAPSKRTKVNGKGGVRVCKSIAEVKENAADMIGKTLVTHQTGPSGKEVKRIYVEEGCAIERELYLSILIDRENQPCDDYGVNGRWHEY